MTFTITIVDHKGYEHTYENIEWYHVDEEHTLILNVKKEVNLFPMKKYQIHIERED